MNYQKQQQNSNNSEGTSEQQPVHKFGATDKVKRIHKKCEKYEKQQDESSEACQTLTKKKKQTAKQLKRIRQQNRRAVHKEYVANLQLQLQKKELQIQKLQAMISDLEQQLSNKVCPKCSGESTETQHVSPVVLQKINSIEVNSFQVNSIEVEPMEQKSFEIDDQFRRVHDQSSLRICFGNKNLLFFFVTMCCLTIGSIADNPQMFLEPIPPHKLKSQMCYLVNHQNLNYYSFNKQANRGHRNWHQEWDDLYCNKKNQQLKLDQNIHRVSDMLNIKQMLWKLLPKKLGSLSGLKNTVEMMLGYDGNQIMRRLLGGRNYYA